jgi:nucleotide-binding universal stress UspA family protein
MTTVLAAIDDSVAAAPVLTAASALAPLLGSAVEAVHVGDPAGVTARACAKRAGVPFRSVPGDPLERLTELAVDDVTAVVVGTRDTSMRKSRVGHLALDLADRISRPLLVVPPQCTPAERIRRVVVALEGSPGRAILLRLRRPPDGRLRPGVPEALLAAGAHRALGPPDRGPGRGGPGDRRRRASRRAGGRLAPGRRHGARPRRAGAASTQSVPRLAGRRRLS